METKKIFVADDDRDLLYFISTILRRDGYDVVASPHAEDLLKQPLQSFDLILLDENMPDIRGSELCRQLRAGVNVQILLVSANGDIKSLAGTCGATDYIEKPFSTHQLLNTVHKYTA